ncbi:hypothetical protein D3C75_739580 [compost metagenome]
MTILLHLGRQRTAAGGLILHIQRLAHLGQCSLGETGPVYSRVGQRLLVAQQLPVLDKQQRLYDQRRYGVEIRVVMGRVLVLIERLGTAVVQSQPRLHLLGIGDEETMAGVVVERIGKTHLLAHLIATLDEALLDHGHQHITESLVEGAIIREGDLLAGTGFQLISQLGGITGDLLRLQSGGLHFITDQGDHGSQAKQKDETEQPAPPGATLALILPVRMRYG